MVDWSETARFPAKLDRDAIITRVAELHEWARSESLAELATLLELPANVSSAEIGSRILSSLEFIASRPEYTVINKQLEILALNLKKSEVRAGGTQFSASLGLLAMKRIARHVVVAVVLVGLAISAQAQTFPAGPISIVVPLAPGRCRGCRGARHGEEISRLLNTRCSW